MKPLFPLPAATAFVLLGLAFPAAAQRPAPLPSLDSTPHVQRAIAAMRTGQWKSARTAWEAVLKLEPGNAAALSNLG